MCWKFWIFIKIFVRRVTVFVLKHDEAKELRVNVHVHVLVVVVSAGVAGAVCLKQILIWCSNVHFYIHVQMFQMFQMFQTVVLEPNVSAHIYIPQQQQRYSSTAVLCVVLTVPLQ